VTSRDSGRMAALNTWAGSISRSSCAASASSPERSRRRCWRTPRCGRRW